MGLLESIQGVTKLATQIANPDLLREVSNANVQALELSETNLLLQKRIMDLELQLRELQTRRDLAKTLFRNGDFVFRDGDPGACCPRCWDAEQKLIHVLLSRSDGAQCPNCKTLYIFLPGNNPGRNDPFSVAV
jgi:hypothetical protein